MTNIKKVLFSALIGVLFITNIQQSSAQVTDPNPNGNTPYCLRLTQGLGYRSTDAQTNGEVSDLQDFLNVNGYLSVQPTGYYGLLTVSAVTRFQSVANGFSSSSGFVGPYTRAKIAAITCASTYSPSPTNTSNTTTTTTTTSSYPSGCSSNSGYSTTTGRDCGCASTSGFSTQTGQSCSATTTTTTTTVAEPWIKVMSPNSSENWYVGTTHAITWDSYRVDYFNLYLEGNGRKVEIVNNISPSGRSYTWTVPSTVPAGYYQVAVSASSNSNVVGKTNIVVFVGPQGTYPSGCTSTSGYSTTTGNRCDGTQSTQPSITVNSPNGGENWQVGSTHNITWSYSGPSDKIVTIVYSTPESQNVQIASVQATSQTYSWIIPSSPFGARSDFRVGIIDPSNSNTLLDAGNNDFTISSVGSYPSGCTSNSGFSTTTGNRCDGAQSSQPSITVTSPNGGENWQVGSTHDITWNYSGPSDRAIQIQLTYDGYAYTITSSAQASLQRYSWTVPSTISPRSYRMSVREVGSTLTDYSDGYFTVSSPSSITITSPNGGENWQIGSTHDITWSYSGSSKDIQIVLYSSNPYETPIIGTVQATSQRYSWTISSSITPRSDYKIEIIDPPNSHYIPDASDNYFTISSASSTTTTTSVTPPSNLVASGGQAQVYLSWSAPSSASTTYKIYRQSFSSSSLSYVGSTANIYYTDSNLLNSATYYYYVTAVTSSGESGYSNQASATTQAAASNNPAPPSITVLSPSSSGVYQWNRGSVYTISWDSYRTDYFDLSLEADPSYPGANPATITIINNISPSDQSYTWTVPNYSQSEGGCYRPYVRWSSNNTVYGRGGVVCITKTSTTTTTTPSVTITSPNAGEFWSTGTSHAINWSTQGISRIQLYLLPVNSDGTLRESGIPITDDMPTSDGGHSYTYAVPNNIEGYYAIGFSYYADYSNTYGQARSGTFTISGKACLAVGTKISMADGSYKNIENVKVGDLVRTLNGSGVVSRVIQREDPIVTINGTLRAAPDEVVYLANGRTEFAGNIKSGEYLVGEGGRSIVVKTVAFSSTLTRTYDFALENGNSFFADGYLVRPLK